MLDTRLTEEQEHLRKTVEDFARKVVAPVAAHHDSTATFPYDVVRQMGEMGLFGLPFPEEYGGMGGDYFADTAPCIVPQCRSAQLSRPPSTLGAGFEEPTNSVTCYG
jgi:alkylation response protein AidB-like acyl-CoA dehydrogenase